MTSIAYAMGQGGIAGGQGAGGGFSAFVPLIIMFAIFYFLLIRPQQKKAKEHQEMLNNLKKGDRVITSGGIYGLITAADETVLTVEIADRIRVKIARSNISTLDQQPPKTKPDKK